MSAPTIDAFCLNGHHVHQYGNMTADFEGENIPKTCNECGSTKIASQWEWGDNSYEQSVPLKPVKYEEKFERVEEDLFTFFEEAYHQFTHHNLYRKGKIPIYDVSKLFEKEGKI